MTRFSWALAALLALAGCNPTAYVPTLLPSVPAAAGVRAVGGGNLVGLHATAEVSAAPVDGAAVYARGLFLDTFLDPERGGRILQRGGDLGLVAAPALSPRVRLDLGVSRGGGLIVENTDRALVSSVGGHVGVLVGGPGDGERRGLALRITHVSAAQDVDYDGGRRGTGVFAEPAFRAGWVRGRVEVQGQFGLSVLVAGDFSDDYLSIPAFGGVTAAVRL